MRKLLEQMALKALYSGDTELAQKLLDYAADPQMNTETTALVLVHMIQDNRRAGWHDHRRETLEGKVEEIFEVDDDPSPQFENYKKRGII